MNGLKVKILKIFGSLFLFLFLSCTAEYIIEEDCIKVAKHCITNRNQTITCTSYYECIIYDN